jgi:hypothetical protein
MTTQDFIIALFYAVDQEMLEVPKHPDAKLYRSEEVTLALLDAIYMPFRKSRSVASKLLSVSWTS